MELFEFSKTVNSECAFANCFLSVRESSNQLNHKRMKLIAPRCGRSYVAADRSPRPGRSAVHGVWSSPVRVAPPGDCSDDRVCLTVAGRFLPLTSEGGEGTVGWLMSIDWSPPILTGRLMSTVSTALDDFRSSDCWSND